MSIETRTLDEFQDVDDEESDEINDDGQVAQTSVENDPQWQPKGVECQCGASVTRWHTRTQSRRLARTYGLPDDTVPACPDCVEWTPDQERKVSVPHAIKHMSSRSSVEPKTRNEVIMDREESQ